VLTLGKVKTIDIEARQRLQQVLSRALHIGHGKIRAVAVLEEIADRDAVRILESLSKGLPESRQTVEALAALRRLREKTTAPAW
jgi:hypothetical protein